MQRVQIERLRVAIMKSSASFASSSSRYLPGILVAILRQLSRFPVLEIFLGVGPPVTVIVFARDKRLPISIAEVP